MTRILDNVRRVWPEGIGRNPIALSLVLFALACVMPALDLAWVPRRPESGPPTQGGSVMAGYEILLLGWMGVLFGQVAWYANPLLAASLVCIRLQRWRVAAALALVALVLAANLLQFDRAQIPTDGRGSEVFALRRLLLGAYLWLASILVAGVGALLGLAIDRAAAAEGRPA